MSKSLDQILGLEHVKIRIVYSGSPQATHSEWRKVKRKKCTEHTCNYKAKQECDEWMYDWDNRGEDRSWLCGFIFEVAGEEK
jgi:hypothetical protein